MEELPLPPEEKKLPAPEEKLLRPPTFSEKYWKFRWLVLCIALILIFIPVSLSLNKISTSPQSSQSNTPTQSLPTSLPTPTADPTANWKTYENSDYSIKYPPDLKLERQDMPDIGNLVGFDSKDQQISITITTWEDIEGKTLQQFITDYSNNLATKENTNSYRVGEIQGLGYINGENKLIFINNKNKVFIFILNNAYDIKTHNLLNKNAEAAFNQILSTFKFLDQTTSQIIPLSTVWQMGTTSFTDPKLGISFEYPKVFTVDVQDVSLSPYKESKITFFMSIRSPDIRPEGDNWTDDQIIAYRENAMLIDIYQYDNSSNQTLNAYLAPLFTEKEIISSASSIPVPGSYVFTGYIGQGAESPSKEHYFMNKGKIYLFKLFGGHSTQDMYSVEGEKVFDQIISSIKFTQ